MTDELIGLPEGFIAHDGGECPIDPDTYVDCIIRTSEGLGHSGVARAKLHEWDELQHPGGIGAVVGYRLAQKGELLPDGHLHLRWPE